MIEKKEVSKARNIFFKTGLGVTVFGITFFAAFLSSSHFMPISESSAETTGTYYANITSSGSIALDLVATPDGIGKVGKDNLSISTNATSGYKLYLSTVSTAPGNGLYLANDNTKSLTATTGSIATPSKLAPNTWGYAPSRATPSDTIASYTDAAADADNGDAVFIGVPEYGDENVIYTNDTPTVSDSNSVDIYYGVNASTALDSGEYSNTVVYTAIVDAVNPFNEEVSISPTSQGGLDAGTEVTISTGLYPGFSADNLGNITVTIGGNACTNVTPSVAEAGNLNITCTAPAASAAGKYDVVVNVAKYNKTYTLTEGYEYVAADYMQDFSASAHSSDATGTTYTLADSRDEKQYIATKLADGNIWMTQDLKLDGGRTLTSADSDVSSDYALPAENTGTWCTDQTAACYNQSLMRKTGAPNGYFYNWHAATAGTGVYGTGAGVNATASICPKGWKLPTKDQYVALDVAYGGNGSSRTDATQRNKFMAAPLNFNYTGWVDGGSIDYPSDYAYYWSRTAYSGTYTYDLYFRSTGNFNPQDFSNKYNGFAVRCVADKTALSDITSMQEMTPAVVANTPAGASKTLTDTRGGSYTVAKLADGNIWMTQDLKLGGSSALTLTPDDSDVASNYTLPAENTGTWCTSADAACYNQSLMRKTGAPNGYLYNWYAATAGTGVYGTGANQNASASICPKGWKLPTGGPSGQFVALDQAYGGNGSNRTDATQRNKFMAAPLNFNYTGSVRGGSVNSPSDSARYWSRTASSGAYAYYLLFSSNGYFHPQRNDGLKYDGFAVRCVAAS